MYVFNLALPYLFFLILPVPSLCDFSFRLPADSLGHYFRVPSDVDELKCYCKELNGPSNR